MHEEDRRRAGRDAQAGSEFILVLGLQVARIGRDGEVRPAADLVDVVDRLVGSLLEARRRGDGQMAARREADHADALRIDAPLLGLAAHQADGPLGILERASGRLAFGLVGAARHPVLEDDAGHALRIQPGRDLLAFQFPVEVPVAAAGTDQDRGPGVLVLRRPIDRDGRFADVGHQPGRLGDLDLLPGELRRHADLLRADVAGLIRNFARPQLHDQSACRPPRAGQATHNQMIRETAATIRFMVAP